MAFTEDLTEFFDATDGFAVEATLDGASVTGILDTESSPGDSTTPSTVAEFVMPASSVPDLPAGVEGLELKIGEDRYGVHGIEIADDLATLHLQRRDTVVLNGFMANAADLAASPTLTNLVETHAEILVDGDSGKWKQLLAASPADYHDYDFSVMDQVVDYAESLSLPYRFAHLLWSKDSFYPLAQGYPIAVAASRQTANTTHIQTVVGRYAGRIPMWDLWNEPIDLDGNGLKQFPGVEDVTYEEIGAAFATAYAADPTAEFGLNEHSCERAGAKQDALLDLLDWLLGNGYPVHFVGLQAHEDVSDPTTRAQWRQTFAEFRSRGVKVLITEADFRVASVAGTEADKQAAQAAAVRDMVAAARIEGVHSIGWWGVMDQFSWIYANDGTSWPNEQPLPFDWDGLAKPAWTAVTEERK